MPMAYGNVAKQQTTEKHLEVKGFTYRNWGMMALYLIEALQTHTSVRHCALYLYCKPFTVLYKL
jgi:hypothetical protein